MGKPSGSQQLLPLLSLSPGSPRGLSLSPAEYPQQNLAPDMLDCFCAVSCLVKLLVPGGLSTFPPFLPPCFTW